MTLESHGRHLTRFIEAAVFVLSSSDFSVLGASFSSGKANVNHHIKYV